MKGDFSRKTFDAARHYSGVLMQQGRVQLDSDANEQVSITKTRWETQALDTFGRVNADAVATRLQYDYCSAWLDLIRDHIATSLSIETNDFNYAPFSQRGGLGKAHQLFGSKLPKLLDELNEVLAA